MFSTQDFLYVSARWTPRVIIVGCCGYYSLGAAYEKGLMAAIDRIAIRTLRHSMGYIGIGAFMPTFQWYSAWSVRFIAVIGSNFLYGYIEKTVSIVYNKHFFQKKKKEFTQQDLSIIPKSRPAEEPKL